MNQQTLVPEKAHQAEQLLKHSEVIVTADQVAEAIDRLAIEISWKHGESVPVVLAVMGGAVVFAGQLLTRLKFPLEFDYLHATRYRGGTRGGEIEWPVLPRLDLSGRTVLLLDDILDEGHTLAAAKVKMLELGAATVEIAVLAEKDLPQAKPVKADYTGLTLPNRYVFGMGMDAYGLWRNLPDIHALHPLNEED